MGRIALLDVNILVALFDPDHVHHDLAHDWFTDHRRSGWATCPVTEAGFIRVVSNPKYQPEPMRPATVSDQLRKFCASGHHHFWPDTVSLLDNTLFALSIIGGHGQLTDAYLLGLAKKMGGTLATFDRTIPVAAVKGAKRDTIALITPADAE